MTSFVEIHGERHRVEPICQVLQVAPRARRDEELLPSIERIWQASGERYGADKVWIQLNRDGVAVARCTVERLMRQEGWRGMVRGRSVRTTIADPAVPCRRIG